MSETVRDADPAHTLVEEAFFLRQNGERAPGGNETWHEWERKAERYLRSVLDQTTPVMHLAAGLQATACGKRYEDFDLRVDSSIYKLAQVTCPACRDCHTPALPCSRVPFPPKETLGPTGTLPRCRADALGENGIRPATRPLDWRGDRCAGVYA